jgi:hypothetical protein
MNGMKKATREGFRDGFRCIRKKGLAAAHLLFHDALMMEDTPDTRYVVGLAHLRLGNALRAFDILNDLASLGHKKAQRVLNRNMAFDPLGDLGKGPYLIGPERLKAKILIHMTDLGLSVERLAELSDLHYGDVHKVMHERYRSVVGNYGLNDEVVEGICLGLKRAGASDDELAEIRDIWKSINR